MFHPPLSWSTVRVWVPAGRVTVATTVQNTPSDYYQNAPCNYYSAFWHSVAVNGLAYGFAYDDDNGQSSDFNSTDAQYVQVAIGF